MAGTWSSSRPAAARAALQRSTKLGRGTRSGRSWFAERRPIESHRNFRYAERARREATATRTGLRPRYVQTLHAGCIDSFVRAEPRDRGLGVPDLTEEHLVGPRVSVLAAHDRGYRI